MIVKIGQVIPSSIPYEWEIRRMVNTLKKQGQIEPLQVKRSNGLISDIYHTHEKDVWGSALVQAAMVLNWPTLLIHVNDKYEM